MFILKLILIAVKVIGALLSLVLIFFSLIRIPEKNVGLASIANKISLLGSPSSTQRSFDIAGVIGIFLYLAIALLLNLIITSN